MNLWKKIRRPMALSLEFLRVIPVFIPILLVLSLALLLGAAGGCNSVFFQPNRIGYSFPPHFGLAYEEVEFKSGDGTLLTGWFIPAKGIGRGTIIHFHGNYANMTHHLPAVAWMPGEGYSVFLFDYRGYGLSEGTPSRAGAVADGVAAIAYVRSRGDVDRGRLAVFGQSLGGALAIAALARAGHEGMRALVVEGAFASYREVARTLLDRSWITWAFQVPLSYLFISDELSPRREWAALRSLPLLVVHGEKDRNVPFENGRSLFEGFPGQDKQFWPIPNGAHINAFGPGPTPWREKLLKYLAGKFPPLTAQAPGPERKPGLFGPELFGVVR